MAKAKTATTAPKPAAAPPVTAEPEAAKPARGATRNAAIALLRRQEGATMAELTAATGWLPHSTRAILSGLRKQGLSVTRSKRDSESCYKIEEQA